MLTSSFLSFKNIQVQQYQFEERNLNVMNKYTIISRGNLKIFSDSTAETFLAAKLIVNKQSGLLCMCYLHASKMTAVRN